MANFSDALRGYAYPVHKRDHFTCRYCGVDGTKSFEVWLTLSWDHLLPRGHPNRDILDYIVTACNFCNCADNRYFDRAAARGISFDDKTPEELVTQRLPYVQATRAKYREFWTASVHQASGADTGSDQLAGG